MKRFIFLTALLLLTPPLLEARGGPPRGQDGKAQVGVGIGLISRTGPYREYDGLVTRVIPAITYRSRRVQLLGPIVNVRIGQFGPLSLKGTARLRIGAYEEDDSGFLQGLGDRHDTLLAGLSLGMFLPYGFSIKTEYAHDVLDEVGGGEAKFELAKRLRYGRFGITPKIGINWMSSKLSDYDFGVPSNKATSFRRAYSVPDTFSTEVGLGVFTRLGKRWSLIINGGTEFLSGKVRNSSIVSKSTVYKTFSALSYSF